jgi:hypothetical protein
MRIIEVTKKDIAAIKKAGYLWGFAYDESEDQWTTTSIKLNPEGMHCHGEGKTVSEAIKDMDKQVTKWIKSDDNQLGE